MSRNAATLRAFRKPRMWLMFWGLMIVAVVVLSLMPKPPIPPTLMVGKRDHLIAYAALAAMAVQLYQALRTQLGVALALVALGVVLELAQGYLTSYRHMAAYDALVDALGVALGLATTRTRLATVLLRIDGRMSG